MDAGVFLLASREVTANSTLVLASQSAEILAGQLQLVGPTHYASLMANAQRAKIGELTLFSTNGEILAGDGALNPVDVGAVVATRQPVVISEDRQLRVLQPVGGPGRPTAVLEVRMPQNAAGLGEWGLVSVHVVLSAIAVVVFGAVLFQRSIVKPMRQLQEGAGRIVRGDLDHAVSEDAPSELSELAQSLNAVAAALQQYQQRSQDQLQRLQQTQEALIQSEKLASVGRLAAGLAHELGNPLTGVRGYVELLRGEVPKDSLAADVLARCRVDVERMHTLLRDLLDFARMRPHLHSQLQVRQILEEAANSVRFQPAFQNITVQVVAPELPIEGHAGQLQQVFLNLLLNAADAGATHIQLQAEQTPTEVQLHCRDNGCGIPEHALSQIFEPFFTTRPPGLGTGLGLAVVHQVIEQHGGRISVHSTPGAGTEFLIRLPHSRSVATRAPHQLEGMGD